ncbi:MAG: glutamate formiminotransferase [Actinomycetota bacterium]|nr:glutamate formiminotransferase [Actinomycetota bacterium]
MTPLLAVPNVSQGRDQSVVDSIAHGFAGQLLDIHSDPDHNRTVFTVAGEPGLLAHTVLAGAAQALAQIDLRRHDGLHPRVGALDVAPIVYLSDGDRGRASAEALVLGDMLGQELKLPVFLYGALGGGRARGELRGGGLPGLAERMRTKQVSPDFGPASLHPSGGAVLVAARPPLVAFNVELARPAGAAEARAIAALIREGGPEGLESVKAIGLWLERRRVAQVSMNIEDHRRTPLRTVVEAIARHATPAAAELVGLAPAAALEGFPEWLALANRRSIEAALGSARAGRD